MAAENTQIPMNRAAEDEAARDIVEVNPHPREIARYKEKLRKFKASLSVTVVALVAGLGGIVGGIFLYHQYFPLIFAGALEFLVGIYGMYGHLKDFGLSVPQINDFSNEEHQMPPLGHDRIDEIR
uniref:Uncharacterized protein n=1 Tax=Leersia perrieri TaxID=77586 RepID=A0A0D9WAT2_9ORYZ